MAPITLAMVAKLEKDPLRSLIINNLLRHGPVLQYLPFENVNALSSVAVRWTNLPTAAFRKINASYNTSTGDVEQVYESVYGFGGLVEIDRVFDKIKASLIKDPRQLQMEMFTKAMAFKWNDYFINGDHAVDVDGFEGLKKRIANMPARQSVRASATTDILDPTANAANARLFIDKWEQANYVTNGGDTNAIFCNELLKWGLGRVVRYATASGGQWLDTTKDSFDREILTYKGAPIIDIGLKQDQTTEIITLTEVAEDAGADATSAYFVSFNMEQGVSGIQLGPLETEDDVNDSSVGKATSDLILIEWWAGLAGWGSYGASRLHNIESPASWT